MIDRSKALDIAKNYLRTLPAPSDDSWVLQENRTQDESYGWIFHFTNKKYAHSADLRDQRPGYGPLLVDKENGEVHQFGSVPAFEAALKDYLQKKKKN